jgi:polyvinyl alcohol dehydrogenase (cytochrome)
LLGSQIGKVYSLDAHTGCTFWEFDAGAAVRTAITVGQSATGWVAYFGDLKANVFAIDACSCRSHRLRSLLQPTRNIRVAASAAALSRCTRRSTGDQLWKTHTITEEPTPRAVSSAEVQLMGPSGAAVWSSPTYDAVKEMIRRAICLLGAEPVNSQSAFT